MNSKEALERLYLGLEDYDTQAKCYELIFKDLDKLEKLEKDIKELRNSIKSWDENAGNLLKENTKLKKVCHILLYKKINIDFLRESKDVDEYNKWISNLMNYRELSLEQYELLKEVFENE